MKHASNVHLSNLDEPNRVIGEPKCLDGHVVGGGGGGVLEL